MHFKRDRYCCGKQNKFGKAACSDNFRPIETALIKALLDDINDVYFSDTPGKVIDSLIEKQLTKFENSASSNNNQDNIVIALDKLNMRKKKAINLLLDESIDKDAYDLLMKELNPQIDQLKSELNDFVEQDIITTVDRQELKAYIVGSKTIINRTNTSFTG